MTDKCKTFVARWDHAMCSTCGEEHDRPAPTPTPAPGLNLDAVERAERAMTPGPWVALPRTEGPDDVAPDGWLTWFEVDSASEKCVAQCASASGSDEANAAGIVTLRNAAPALIAEVRALRAKLAEVRELIVDTEHESSCAIGPYDAAQNGADCSCTVGAIAAALEVPC